MDKIKIYLGDLEHTWEKVNTWTFPLNVGYVGTYAKKNMPNNVDVTLFKDPFELIELIKKEPPDIVGLTFYVWSRNLAGKIMEIVKEINSNILTVGGGPEFTNLNYDNETAKEFFNGMGKFCDSFIVNQGEKGFLEILKNYIDVGKNIKRLKEKDIKGCLINNIVENGSVRLGEKLDSIIDLDDIPSPYLTGLMDKFFSGPYAPILETNRSCPYRCTFCAWGIGTEKLARFSDERIFSEIDYFSKKVEKTKILYIADANYAIFERDANISKKLYQASLKYNYPKVVNANWNKTRPERVLAAAKNMKGLARIGASMQSFHQPTLENIKRKNHTLETISSMSQELLENNLKLYSELILGLPFETKESHIKGIKLLMDVNAEIFNFNLHLLPGTELESKQSRKKYVKKVGFRMFDGCYGIYEGRKVIEGEEVVIATNTMPENDLRNFRFIHFLIQFMWSKEFYLDFLNVFKSEGIHPVDIIIEIEKECKKDKKIIGNLYKGFKNNHDLEQFKTYKDLCNYWFEENNFKKLKEGDYGKLNYLYTFLFLENREHFDKFLYKYCLKKVKETGIKNKNLFIFKIKDVLRFVKGLFIDLSKGTKSLKENFDSFSFDFVKWRKNKYKINLDGGTDKKFRCKFYVNNKNSDLLKTQLNLFKSHNMNMTLRQVTYGISPDKLFYSTEDFVN